MTARIIASCLCVRESSTWFQTRSLATTTCTACRFNVGRRSRRQLVPHVILRYESTSSGSGGEGKDPASGGVFRNFVDNLRKNLEKNKEIQENLKAFEKERNRIVRTDSVKLFKEKISGTQEWLVTVTLKSIDLTRNSITSIRKSTSQLLKKFFESEVGKQSHKVTREVSKKAQETAERLSDQAEAIGKTDIYKTVSKGAETVKEDLLDDIIKESSPYKPPEQILKRSERSSFDGQEPAPNVVQPDDEAKDIIVTRRSKLKEKWSKFRENNPVSNLIYDMRMRYDESDNIVIRVSRTVTDKLSFEGMSKQSDMSLTLAEIHKVDPSFDKEMFINECKTDIIPTILEAFLQGKVDILKDWCHEAAFKVLSAIIKQREGDKSISKVLDIHHVDILGGKVLDQGPVMILSFTAQQVTVKQKESSYDETLESIMYVWALCRDQSIYDPKVAWRIMEFGIQASGHLLV